MTSKPKKARTLALETGVKSDPSPYFEPFLRSLLLGCSFALLFESGHLAAQLASLTGERGYLGLAEAVPKVWDQFSPLLASDHVVAMSCFLVSYAWDSMAVMTALKDYQKNPEAAATSTSTPRQAQDLASSWPRKIAPHMEALTALVLAAPGIQRLRSSASTAGGLVAELPAEATSALAEFTEDAAAAAASVAHLAEGQAAAAVSAATATAVAAGTHLSKLTHVAVPLPPAISGFVDAPAVPQDCPEAPPQPETGSDGDFSVPGQLPNPPFAGPSGNVLAFPPVWDRPAAKPRLPRVDEQDDLAERRRKQGLKPGQWDPRQGELARRAVELQGRRSYLKNFWYAAAISEQVKDKPVGVEILGQQVVLFRDSKTGAVSCVSDICPHRGAPLHRGWVKPIDGHDCVVCPYHGWAFDGEGMLRDVPAVEPGQFPHKQVLAKYPVEEKGGFVWLFYGSSSMPAEERPPIPFVPELEDPSWKPVYGSIEFECNHWSVFENAIDMAHIHYLHDDTFGNQDKPKIQDMACTRNAFGVTATFTLHNKPVSALWEFSKVPEVHVTAQALLPSTSVITFTLGNGLSFTTFVNTVPISADRTINRFALVRKLDMDKFGLANKLMNLDAWDKWAEKAMLRILSEDKAMVETLRPDLLAGEVSVRADMPQIAFRRLRQEYLDLGYAISPEAAVNKFRSGDL